MPYATVTKFCTKYFGCSPSETIMKRIVHNVADVIKEAEQSPEEDDSFVQKVDKNGISVVSVDGGRCKTTYGNWKEVKLGVVFEYNQKQKGDIKYFGEVDQNIHDFTDTFERNIKKYGANESKLLAFVADGMPYNWDLKANVIPDAVEILDYYHACEHLSVAVAAVHEEGSLSYKNWQSILKDLLYLGEKEKLIRWIEHHLQRSPNDKLLKEKNYFENNMDRIDYPKYRSQGLPMGSGVMEASVKKIVNQRIKSSEKTWTKDGANAVLKIKMAVENREIEHYTLGKAA